MKLENLTEFQLDALREVGGIGAGHAATALSQLVDRPIALEVPLLEVVALHDIPHVLGGPERLVGAVFARLLGDISGGILFVAEKEGALSLIDLLHGREVGSTKSFGHDEEALLRHCASILISAYLAAIARMADLDVLPSSASIALDMAGALLEAVISEVGMVADHAVLVRTSFMDEDNKVEAALFFVPTPESLEIILGRLGVI